MNRPKTDGHIITRSVSEGFLKTLPKRNPSLTHFEVAQFVHHVPSPPIHLRIWLVVKRLQMVANVLGERAG